MNSVTMNAVWKALTGGLAAMRLRLTGAYRPEKYYMRGPGPRARAKDRTEAVRGKNG